MSDGRNRIPLTSRRAESLMPLPVTDRRATVAPYPSLVAARADVAEADTAQRIAADPSVIDAERHPLYGHGVQQSCTCQYGEATPPWYVSVKRCAVHGDKYAPDTAPAWAATMCGPGGAEVWADAEHARQSRLSRWQEQR